jgi:LssY C-terminus
MTQNFRCLIFTIRDGIAFGRVLAMSMMIVAVATLSGCTTLVIEPLEIPDDLTGVQTKKVGDVAISVAILTDEQAQAHFGADLGASGVQALWISVRNGSPYNLWFIRNTIDPDFYSTDEVALLLKKQIPDRDFERIRQYYRDESIRVLMKSGMITEGFVLLPKAVGGRYIDIRLAQDAYQADIQRQAALNATVPNRANSYLEVRSGFALPLPDGEFDYERLDTENTYGDLVLPNLDTQELRTALEELPCCGTDADGEDNGDPLNIVIVGEATDVLNSLSRSGWSFTHRITLESIRRVVGAAISDTSYPVAPVSSLYTFGRKQDFALQRARELISQRNHMRLWLAPFLHEGRQVWVGQVSRDIGIKLTLQSPTVTTHIIDPEVDLTREYLFHSLLAEGFVDRFGFVKGAPAATRSEPAYNLTSDPYFSDGLRLVVILSPNPVPYDEVNNLLWEQSMPPTIEGQTEAAEKNVRSIH